MNAGGLENYPVALGLDLLALLGPMYWRSVGPTARAAVLATAAAVVATGWALHPASNHPAHLALTCLWALPIAVAGVRLARELDSHAESYANRRMAESDRAVQRAFCRGQQLVLGLVRQAADETRSRLAVMDATLSPKIAGVVRDRLEEVERRLAALPRSDE